MLFLESIELFGLKVHAVDYGEALEKVREFIRLRKPGWAVCINPEKAVQASRSQELHHLLKQGDLCLADGIGIVLAAKVLQGKQLRRITGIDLMKAVVVDAGEQGYSLFLLGAKPGVAEIVAQKWQDRHPGLQVAGVHHGYFSKAEEPEIVQTIRKLSPDILLVALGSPRQERWIMDNLGQMEIPFLMGVGGSFDVEAGITVRAPLFWQKAGLEWFYRLLKEPRRIVRMGYLPRFAWLLLVSLLGSRKAMK